LQPDLIEATAHRRMIRRQTLARLTIDLAAATVGTNPSSAAVLIADWRLDFGGHDVVQADLLPGQACVPLLHRRVDAVPERSRRVAQTARI